MLKDKLQHSQEIHYLCKTTVFVSADTHNRFWPFASNYKSSREAAKMETTHNSDYRKEECLSVQCDFLRSSVKMSAVVCVCVSVCWWSPSHPAEMHVLQPESGVIAASLQGRH